MICQYCKQKLSKDKFYKQNKSRCIKCYSQYNKCYKRASRDKNPDFNRSKWTSEYMQNHPERIEQNIQRLQQVNLERSRWNNPKIIKELSQKYISGISARKLSEEYKATMLQIKTVLKRNGIAIRNQSHACQIYQIDETYFNDINSPDKAYFLGFLFADGSISQKGGLTFQLQEQDGYIVELLKTALKSTHPIKKVQDNKFKTFSIKLYVSNMSLVVSLNKLGLLPKKSTSTFVVPAAIPFDLLNHFIRGYFDGDGSVFFADKIYDRKKITILSNLPFLNSIKTILERELKSNKIYIHTTKSSYCHELTIQSKEEVNKFYNYIYRDCKELYLKRKKEKFEQLFAKPQYSETIIVDGIELNKENLIGIVHKLSKKEQDNIVRQAINIFIRFDFDTRSWFSKETIENQYKNIKEFNTGDLYNSGSTIKAGGRTQGLKLVKRFYPQIYDTRRYNGKSIREIFYDTERIEEVIRNRMGITYKEVFDIKPSMIIRGIHIMKLAFPASFFMPVIAKWIVERYSDIGDIIFDCAAGYGSRMFGTCSCDREYIGIDISKKNIISANEAIEFLKLNAKVILHDSRDYNESIKRARLFLIDPPYYDLEIYDNEKHPEYEKWLIEYWDKTLRNIYNNKNKYSKIAIIVGKHKKYNLNNDLKEIAKKYFVLSEEFNISYLPSPHNNNPIDFLYIFE